MENTYSSFEEFQRNYFPNQTVTGEQKTNVNSQLLIEQWSCDFAKKVEKIINTRSFSKSPELNDF